MAEFLCRLRDHFTAGSIFPLDAEINPINGLFTITRPRECEGCMARRGPVKISGGIVIKNSEDEWRVGMELVRFQEVEKLNVVNQCEKV